MISRVRELIEDFAASLAQVLESMAEQKPQVNCGPPAPAFEGESILWWEQPLQISPEMKIYVGAPAVTWRHAGTITLRAAGLEAVEDSEARNTWIEILGQALGTLARAMGAVFSRETTCDRGAERAPGESDPDSPSEWIPVRLTFAETELAPLYVGFSPALLEALTRAQSSESPHLDSESAAAAGRDPGAPIERSRTMNLLLDIDLPVSISFGKTQLAMRDVIKLTTGSIVELDRGVSEPVDVLVNGSLVARGEVVVVEGNYGVRILEIASRLYRMKTLR